MTAVKPFIEKFKQKLSNQFIRNVSWLGIAEVIPRIFRLGVVVILARFLTPYDYGLAAIVGMVGEFTRIFMDIGISAKIVQADQEDVEALCNSAYWLNWTVFLGIFFIQCIAAFPVSWFYQESKLIPLICVAAINYLLLPIAAVQYALVQRENKLKITAIANATQNSVSWILSAIFAVLGLGVWSVVLPSVLVVPLWIVIYYVNHPWRPTGGFTTKHWNVILNFGKNIIGVHLLKTLRNNLDYLIVGRFIGVEELGLYFFGFNAGLGISLSAISALNSALYPHLCAVRANWVEFKNRYFSSLKIISYIIIPMVLLQSSLAYWYVPIFFGQKWIPAIPILVLICLTAIPRAFSDAASQLLVAFGQPNLDLRWHVLFTVIFAGGLLMGVRGQVIGVATSVFLVHAIALPLFTVWATRYVFRKA